MYEITDYACYRYVNDTKPIILDENGNVKWLTYGNIDFNNPTLVICSIVIRFKICYTDVKIYIEMEDNKCLKSNVLGSISHVKPVIQKRIAGFLVGKNIDEISPQNITNYLRIKINVLLFAKSIENNPRNIAMVFNNLKRNVLEFL